MKKHKIKTAVFIIALMLVISCYYDNEETLYPQLSSTCDTINVSFSGTIVPILSGNCFSCHSDANAAFGGGVRLQAPVDVQAKMGKIMQAIDGSGPKPMPPNGRLKACSVNQFRIWLKNGSPLN